MWAKLVVSVTLLPMLFHSILGCCWHHAHSEYCSTNALDQKNSHQCCSHRHCHGDDLSIENDGPVLPVRNEHQAPSQRHESCDGVDCVYVTAKATQSPTGADFCSRGATRDGDCSVVWGTRIAVIRSSERHHRRSTAVEYCALAQVWMI
jgi:hypothetical protein